MVELCEDKIFGRRSAWQSFANQTVSKGCLPDGNAVATIRPCGRLYVAQTHELCKQPAELQQEIVSCGILNFPSMFIYTLPRVPTALWSNALASFLTMLPRIVVCE